MLAALQIAADTLQRVPQASWLSVHGFQAIQTVGIMSGLIFAGYNARQNARMQRLSNLFQLTTSHRQLWIEVVKNNSLHRVMSDDVDLAQTPVTVEEQVWVTMKLLHLASLFEAQKVGVGVEAQQTKKDLQSFISRPIQHFVWEKMSPFLNRDFVAHVNSALALERLLPKVSAR